MIIITGFFYHIYTNKTGTVLKSAVNNIFVIVNPNAGNGKGKKDWDRISALLLRIDPGFRAAFSEGKGHASRLAEAAAEEGYRTIITVGGDGTLNEVLNGIYARKSAPPAGFTLGIIPVGTGNDWGRMFGIPLVYDGAAEVISAGRTMPHDVGVVTYYEENRKLTRYFINIAGLGFESVVVKKTNRQKEKGKSGKAIYLYNLLSSLITYRHTEARLTIDGSITSSKIFSVNVGNGRYCGGGMRQTPDALPDDGLLDITVIRDIGKLEIIRSLKILYDGTILSHPKVDGYRAKNLIVESEIPLFVEADGETLGHTPAEFSVIPAGINIIYGSRIIH